MSSPNPNSVTITIQESAIGEALDLVQKFVPAVSLQSVQTILTGGLKLTGSLHAEQSLPSGKVLSVDLEIVADASGPSSK